MYGQGIMVKLIIIYLLAYNIKGTESGTRKSREGIINASMILRVFFFRMRYEIHTH